MAWDSTRAVPWQRLIRDWLLYIGIMAAVFVFVYRDDLSTGPFVGLLVSGPLFLVVGAVLAKFGYTRKTMRDLRAEGDAKRAAAAAVAEAPKTRTRPAPTRRTSTGPGRGGGRGSSRPGKKR